MSETADGEQHAFLWDRGRMLDLTPAGASGSGAYDINDRGQIVGHTVGAESVDAVMWTVSPR